MEVLKRQLEEREMFGLALDIDETLSNTVLHWMEELQKLFGNPEGLTPQELVAKYRYTQEVPYWQHKAAREWMASQIRNNVLQRALPLIDGAVEGVREVHAALPIVAYITVRPVDVVDGTRDWLAAKGFPEARIIARPKEVGWADGTRWKAQVLVDLFPRVAGIVDDSPSLLKHLPGEYLGIVYHFGATQRIRRDIAVIPCETWKDVRRAICGC